MTAEECPQQGGKWPQGNSKLNQSLTTLHMHCKIHIFLCEFFIAMFCEWAACDCLSWISHISVVAVMRKIAEKG